MQRFARELEITAETRVLDVGGTPETWDMLVVRPRVTLLNTPRTKAELAGASWWVAGDGCALPFRDGAFDVVFSNSVIEHVGDAESQRRFAREVARVLRQDLLRGPRVPHGARLIGRGFAAGGPAAELIDALEQRRDAIFAVHAPNACRRRNEIKAGSCYEQRFLAFSA